VQYRTLHIISLIRSICAAPHKFEFILNIIRSVIIESQRGNQINLHSLQLYLENIYDIRINYDINQFVFHDIDRLSALQPVHGVRNSKELLFISESTDGLELSLYLDEPTVHELAKNNPFKCLNQDNLNAFCLVAEGISHFVYLIWSATHNRTVSQLELELQAEVDKYILCASMLANQANGKLPANLCDLLFERITYNSDLSREQELRYRLANDYANSYCRRLHHRMINFGESKLITNEIRRFYRLWHQHKMKRINTLCLH